jgi:hypothetical protein
MGQSLETNGGIYEDCDIEARISPSASKNLITVNKRVRD